MKPLSDDAWVARLRSAYAEHGDQFESALAAERTGSHLQRPVEEAHGPCPFCEAHPPLRRFPAHLAAAAPLLYCAACYGFFASATALSAGVSGDAGDHPALRAGRAPARCRSCFGFMMPDGRCAKCKQPVPPFQCPSCRVPMDRRQGDGITLDHCPGCRGTWFDMGELAATFEIEDTPSLVEQYARVRAAEADALTDSLLGRRSGPFQENMDGTPLSTADGFLSVALQVLAMLVRLRF